MDVPTDFLDQMFVADPAKSYFLADKEEFRPALPEKYKIAKDVFKDLLK